MARAFTARIGGVALGGVIALGVVGNVLAAEESVTIENFAFDPADLTVSVGDTVTWSNNDSAAHTATADGGSFDTGTIAGGGAKGVTFSTAGTFTYHCRIHATMTGRVVVQATGGGGGSATTPPTDTAHGSAPAVPALPIDLFTALLVAAGMGGLWLGGVFASDRIRHHDVRVTPSRAGVEDDQGVS
jgi:plastocyanin